VRESIAVAAAACGTRRVSVIRQRQPQLVLGGRAELLAEARPTQAAPVAMPVVGALGINYRHRPRPDALSHKFRVNPVWPPSRGDAHAIETGKLGQDAAQQTCVRHAWIWHHCTSTKR
jgi:hypothetical protein